MAIKGASAVIAELRAKNKNLDRIIDAETKNAAFKIEKDAKTLAPKNFGKLAQSISNQKTKGVNYKVTVNENYGAYMEFGTGAKVRVPDEFKDMANSFKGQKTGTYKQGLENIKVWCRSKGIDEKYAYVIFAKILGAGVNPQPFLYPAWIKGKREYLKALNNILKKYK